MLDWFRRYIRSGKWTKDRWRDSYWCTDAKFRIHRRGRDGEIVFEDALGISSIWAEPVFEDDQNFALFTPRDVHSGKDVDAERARAIIDVLNDAFRKCDGMGARPVGPEGTQTLVRLSTMNWSDPGRFRNSEVPKSRTTER